MPVVFLCFRVMFLCFLFGFRDEIIFVCATMCLQNLAPDGEMPFVQSLTFP